MTARLCKYGCGTEIEWDKTLFRESKTAEHHTPQRCKEIKAKKGIDFKPLVEASKAVDSSFTDKNQLTRLETKIDRAVELSEAILILVQEWKKGNQV